MRCAIGAVLLLVLGGAAQAQKYIDLHSFGGSITTAGGKNGSDGVNSSAAVTFDAAGNMYGTAGAGGADGAGMVWELTTTGLYKDLHDFGGTITNAGGTSGPDGETPIAGVTIDKTGDLFGTTSQGGPNDAGTGGDGMVWEITAAGAYVDLHDFGGSITNASGTTGPDGTNPYGGVALDARGDLFGTTVGGGPNANADGGGIIWKLDSSGYTDLHDFGGTIAFADGTTGTDGIFPAAGITIGSSGTLYGTTFTGGEYYSPGGNLGGILWSFSSSAGYHDLHDFGGSVKNATSALGPDGSNPWGGVTIDPSGNLYGTTMYGGGYSETGTTGGILWSYSSAGAYTDLHDFGGSTRNTSGLSGADGSRPVAGLTFDGVGSLYGTTLYGGPNDPTDGGDGILFKFTISSKGYSDIHDFGASAITGAGATVADGTMPDAGVTFDSAGNIYGASYWGGPNDAATGGDGLVWTITTSLPKKVSLSATSVVGDLSFTGVVTLSSAAPAGGVIVSLSSSSTSATVPSYVKIAAGSTNATFTGTTLPVSVATTATLTAADLGTSVKASLTIEPPAIHTLTLSPTALIAGSKATGSIVLSGKAPSGGTTVTLSSSLAAARVPASVAIPAGGFSATFSIQTTGVSSQTTATIKATAGGTTLASGLTINPYPVTAISISPIDVTGGLASAATVTISTVAPTGGVIVNLLSSSTAVTVQSRAVVPAGKTSAQVVLNSTPVASNTTATITASTISGSKAATITVVPPALSTISVNPSTIKANGSATGTVVLTGAAPSGGITVTLSSNSTYAKGPATVVVAAGKVSATFTITAGSPTKSTVATITAKLGSLTKTVTLTVQ